MEITKEILESILDAYSYEIVFVDRQHIVRYMNKTARKNILCNHYCYLFSNACLLYLLHDYAFIKWRC